MPTHASFENLQRVIQSTFIHFWYTLKNQNTSSCIVIYFGFAMAYSMVDNTTVMITHGVLRMISRKVGKRIEINHIWMTLISQLVNSKHGLLKIHGLDSFHRFHRNKIEINVIFRRKNTNYVSRIQLLPTVKIFVWYKILKGSIENVTLFFQKYFYSTIGEMYDALLAYLVNNVNFVTNNVYKCFNLLSPHYSISNPMYIF